MKQPLLTLFLSCILLACISREVIAQQVAPVRVNASNAHAYRETLMNRIFGNNIFPYDILPDTLISHVDTIDQISPFPYTGLYYPAGNLDSVDKIIVSVDSNLSLFSEKARIYLFHPHNNNGKLFIYHAGHCATTAVAEDILANNNGTAPGVVIPRLIAEGYTVLAVPMIHYRNNPPPGYTCGYNGHNELFTEGNYAFPLGLFFRPLIASLNMLGRGNYSSIYMCGLSGGGWTTSLYPAIDSSISISIPVAGSWPMAVRQAFFPGGGDVEQTYPPVFNNFMDYHDLYTLSCLAPARKMLQINNRYDPCCFNGSVAQIYYTDSVQQALKNTGGEFRFYLDESSTGHVISPKAMDVISAFIKNDRGSLLRLPPDTLDNGQTYSLNLADEFRAMPNISGSRLNYSLLKAPQWLAMNSSGLISGVVPPSDIISGKDSISFKVEDDAGRFMLYNHILTKRRPRPYLFTMNDQNNILYWLPEFSASLDTASQLAAAAFSFTNPLLQVTQVNLLNRSVVALTLSAPIRATDLVSYTGNGYAYSIKFSNGQEVTNFIQAPVSLNAVTTSLAKPGMMRFNTDTMKFEYFNGTQWINMH